MACETMRKPRQTREQRSKEVLTAKQTIDKMVAAKKVGVKVGPQGAITFTGIPEDVRNGVTDACVLNYILMKGTAASKLAVTNAERLAGRRIDRAVINQGVHSHDGGHTWGRH